MNERGRTLLCIDMAYTMQTVQKTNRTAFCEARHFLGMFRKVYALHPLSDIAGGNTLRRGVVHRLTRDQVVIEGVAFRFDWPAFLQPLNLILSQASLMWRLARLIRRRKIDAIYATDAYYLGLFGLGLKVLTGVKLVVSVMANFDEAYEATRTLAYPRLFRFRAVENMVAAIVLRCADLVAGGNRNNLGWALRHGASEAKSTVFTVAINIDPSHMAEVHSRDLVPLRIRLGHRQDVLERPRMVVISRLIEPKLPWDALRAMKIACDENPEAVGFFAGDGPMRAEMEAWVQAEGLHERIFFLGNVEQQVLAALLPGSVVVSPLTGMALIEAGLAGAAIAAYDRDWQAEFVSDGVDGFVVPFKDVDALGHRASQLLREPDTYATFSRRIREKSLQLASKPRLQQHFHEQWSRVLA